MRDEQRGQRYFGKEVLLLTGGIVVPENCKCANF